MHSALSFLIQGCACKCPKCHKGNLYKSRFSVDLRDVCDVCGLDLSKNDSADGPAVFMIFVLGFALVPMALLFEVLFAPPLWVHGVLWGAIAILLTVGMLKPLKSCVIAIQYKHRSGDFE